MMLNVEVDAVIVRDLIARYPQAMDKSINLFADKVGFRMEAESKIIAPHVSGNLDRNIHYADSASRNGGFLFADANYSKYVHGAPFHKNKMNRRETPFFTDAISSLDSYINREAKEIFNRVLK